MELKMSETPNVEYTPYGETWIEKTDDYSNMLPYKFTAKELDSETGLYYYGARYLNPRTSRWISSDPAMEGINWYAYANNNPVKYIDPTGMVPIIGIFGGKMITPRNYEGAPQRRENLGASQQAAMRNPDYQRGAGGPFHKDVSSDTTWCNQATFDIADNTGMGLDAMTGGESRWNTTANESAVRLDQEAGRIKSPDKVSIAEVSPEKAQSMANEGFTVLGAWENKNGGSGHIASVMPSDKDFDSTKGPLMANVGDSTGTSFARKAFGVDSRSKNTASSMSDIKYYYNPNQFNGE